MFPNLCAVAPRHQWIEYLPKTLEENQDMGWSCCSIACDPNRPMRYGIQIAALAIRDEAVPSEGGKTSWILKLCLRQWNQTRAITHAMHTK
jgi:hypothetical protein